MPVIHFLCPSCHAMFSVPSEKIPPNGGSGRCQGCGVRLVIFPNGKVSLVEAQPASAAAAPPPPPSPPPQVDLTDLPIWEIQFTKAEPSLGKGPFTLDEVREMILEEKISDGDAARVMTGDWAPARSYPALSAFFAEHLQRIRDTHGDEEHCAAHKDRIPSWQCGKCGDYLCMDCVINRPLIPGGADYFLCAECEAEVRPVKRKSALKGLFGGKRT